jgi:hypothetical protein
MTRAPGLHAFLWFGNVCPITSSYAFCSDFLLTNMSYISMELTYDQFSMLINRFIKLRLSRTCCYVCRLRPCLIIVYKAEAYPHEAPPLSVFPAVEHYVLKNVNN